jgi:hypothetical protein
MSAYHERLANKLPTCECGGMKYGKPYYAEQMRGSYGNSWYAICRNCQQVFTMSGTKVAGGVEYGTAD